MLVAWVLFPLVLLAVCLGCGLLVERIAGFQLSGGLLFSLGLIVVIVAATLTTARSGFAKLTTPVVIVLAVAGYASSWRRVRALRPRGWGLAVGVGVYAIAAAPVVLSGRAGFLGYFTLNDASFQFALIDQLLAHGPNLAGLPVSSYSAVLHSYLSTSYPIGSQVALGAVRPLVGQDVAWVFQPYMAVIISFGAVALYDLLQGVVRSEAMRALCAFIAGQAGLLYAFYLEASIKEVAATWIVTTTVALVFVVLRERVGLRRLVPLVLAVVAGLDVLKLTIVPWLIVPLCVFVAVAAWRLRHAVRRASPTRLVLTSAGVAAGLFALAAPVLSSASTFLNVANSVLTEPNDLGNLIVPLQNWEVFGIWPSGDFRYGLPHVRATFVLIGIAGASAVMGVLWLWRRRAWAPLLLVVGNAIAATYLLSRASPYASAKVMAIFSASVVLAAMLGAAALHEGGRRLEGWGLAVVVAGGVLWTNALAFHDSSIAPRERLAQLAFIGGRYAGQGPAFYNLSDEFAVHFLRRLAPTDVAFGPPPARPGLARTPAQVRLPWDPDELSLSYLEQFPLLVLGRSPLVSRPPANFELVYEDSYYEVWKRNASLSVLAHLPLGEGLQPSSVPRCAAVVRLSRRAARAGARLAYVKRSPMPYLVPTQAVRPLNWGLVDGDPYELIPRSESGTVSGAVAVAHPGRYEVWLEGSFGQRVDVSVAGRHVGSVEYQLGPPGQFLQVGQTTLGGGTVVVSISGPADNKLRPGAEGAARLLGPLMLVPVGEHTSVSFTDPAHATALCHEALDWIEIVR
jgi:hypothetical protein